MRLTIQNLGRSVIFFTAFIIFYSLIFRSSDYITDELVITKHIPPFWHDACQFLELPVTGIEGQFTHEKYRLRGLSITFRHGVRSSLSKQPNDFGCSPYREEDRRKFNNYLKLSKSEDFEYFLRLDPKYKTEYTILPERSKCESGQLTAEGALQHLKLGKFMNKRYGASNIFTSEGELNVTVITSLYNRTLQSGVAFSTGFFFPMKTRLPQLYIKATPHTSLCASEKCVCNHSWTYNILPFDHVAPRELVLESKNWLETFDIFLEPRPLVQILDNALTRYICRRKTLPCEKDSCISYDFLQNAWNFTSLERRLWNYDETNPSNHKMNVAIGYGVLFQTYQQIQHMKTFPHTNMVKIFSGHDSTVAPILHTLKIGCLDFPRFVARIVFEIFDSKTDTNRLSLRILFNGEDVTKQATFCADLIDGLCPVEQFEHFIERDIPKILGGKTFLDACRQ